MLKEGILTFKKMKKTTAFVGQFCVSEQGRDEGRTYVIVAVSQFNYVYVADGKYNLIAKPKKKNVKHLRLLGDSSQTIRGKLIANEEVYDSEIKYAIRSFASTSGR